ncbi:MAG TPA: histidine kinase, partial [Sphingobacteriaceae bacterium]
IYSLSYQKSDKTPEAILKLSEIMRYMLYESNDSTVELSKELRYLENFIELQKLRFKDNTVDFTQTGDIRDQRIAPLILIAFIENAFKHGIANDPQNPIRIHIEVCDGALKFNVVNKESKQNKDETGGIGLINVQRRLDLLYPEKYDLNISTADGVYTAELSLIL